MESAPDPERNAEKGSAGPALALLLAYALFRLALALVRLPLATPPWALLLVAAVSSVLSIGLPALAIAALARREPPRGRLVLGALVGLAVWLGLGFLMAQTRGAGWLLVSPVQDMAMIGAMAAAGIALGLSVREPNILFPAALFAAFADFVVVNFGTVNRALSTEGGQKLLQSVSAKVPTSQVHPGLAPWSLTIGPADFLFLGFFLACAARFNMGVSRNALVLGVVLGAALFLVPFVHAVPALLPMAVAFVALNWRHFRLSRQELVGSVVVLLVTGALFWGYFLWVFPRNPGNP
ncbi:MAG: hypothetical protein ACK47B_25425 [Armatimonadota bacterium]